MTATVHLVTPDLGCGHLVVQASLNGVNKGAPQVLSVSEITAPVDDEDIKTFIKIALKIYKVGKSNAVAKAGIVAGIDITIP